VTPPAFAAERRRACSTAPAAGDRHLQPAVRSAANPPVALLLSIDETDGRTDGRLTVP